MRASKALIRGTSVVTGLGMGLAMGCLSVRPDPNHCANLDGDRTCEERYPGERTFCAWGTCGPTPDEDGCVAERPADAACYSPCGDGARFDDDASCLADTSSSSGEESTSTGEETGTDTDTASSESSSTGPMPCVGNEDCPDAAAPFCEVMSGECVGCDGTADPDGACAELDPMAPLCVGGACVQCIPENPAVCDDQLLLCDAGTNSCTACTEHGQCGSGACELAVGRCFPEDFVVTVDGDGGADYMTVVAAVAAVDDGTSGVIVVHELDGSGSYQNPMPLVIDGGKTIALLAAPGEAPRIQGTGGNSGLRVDGAATILYADGLSLRSGDALGLDVNGAFAWVDRSHIVQNAAGGIVAQNAAELTLRNCFVGGAVSDVDAVTLNASALDMLYTTVGGGPVLGARSRALYCEGASMASVRNSVLVSADMMPEVECPGATLTNSVTESDVGMLDIMWFMGYATGDFHLSAAGVNIFDGAAEWRTGDPLFDIDGQPRPTEDGTPDYAGADLVP